MSALRDWSVLKVMFTAIVVAAVGLQLLGMAGVLDLESVFVPTSLMMASAIGVLVGAPASPSAATVPAPRWSGGLRAGWTRWCSSSG